MNVFIIAAMSADGFIARDSDHLADWTNTADKKLFVELTKRAGVMIMGRATYDTIGRALPGRQTIVYSRSELELPEDVSRTDEDPRQLLARLEQDGYPEVAICGGAAIYSLFMEAGLVDELYLTIEPVVFGSGLTLFNGPLSSRLRLLESRELAPDVELHRYQVVASEEK